MEAESKLSSQKAQANKTLDKRYQNFINKAQEVHGKNLYDYQYVEYINTYTNINIYCNKCEKIFPQAPKNHLRGKGCPDCGKEKIRQINLDTKEIFIQKSINVHGLGKYDYSRIDYINSRTDIIIICNKCQYNFPTRPSNHIQGNGCPKCAIRENTLKKTRTLEEFIQLSQQLHPNKFEYDKAIYVNEDTKIKLYCHGCMDYIDQLPRSHLQGYGCRLCAIRKRTTTVEQFKERSIAFHGNTFDLSNVNFVTLRDYVELTCLVCMTTRTQMASQHLVYGCKNCADKCCLFTNEMFLERSRSMHGDRYDYSKCIYKGSMKVVENILCKECDKFFPQKARDHWNGCGCPNCNSFKSEKICRELFEYLFQNTFTKQRPKWLQGLELDGYNENLQLAFEYQGQQHFEFISFIHKTQENFFRLQERDKRKKELCIKYGVNLIEIPYTYNYTNKYQMMNYIRKQLEPLGWLFIFPTLDLRQYIYIDEIHIPKHVFLSLKNMNRMLAINSIMKILENFKYPLVPLSHNRLKDLNNLIKHNSEINDNKISTNTLGRIFLNYFMIHVMIKAHKPNKPTYVQCWEDKKLLEQLINRLLSTESKMINSSLWGCYGCKYGKVYNFPPNIAKCLFNYYKAKNILDPCAGYGGRLLGFWVSNAESYIGIDPNKIVPYTSLIETLHEVSDNDKNVQIFNECAEEFNYSKINPVDFIFTSPPYFNLEIYSHDETQSCIRYPTYEEWLDKFLFKMISSANTALIKDGYFCINIKEYKNKGLINSMKEYMKSINLTLINEITMIQPKRYKNNKNYERIYIFQK